MGIVRWVTTVRARFLALLLVIAATLGAADPARSQGGTLQSCGTVEEFEPATANAQGLIVIGLVFDIAPGTVLEGQEDVQRGAVVCLRATVER